GNRRHAAGAAERCRRFLSAMQRSLEAGSLPPKAERDSGMGRMTVDSWRPLIRLWVDCSFKQSRSFGVCDSRVNGSPFTSTSINMSTFEVFARNSTFSSCLAQESSPIGNSPMGLTEINFTTFVGGRARLWDFSPSHDHLVIKLTAADGSEKFLVLSGCEELMLPVFWPIVKPQVMTA